MSFPPLFQPALCAYLLAVLMLGGDARAQVPGANVNMVSGTEWPGGDPYLQRQNEPTMAVSSRNAVHLLAGANDYRTVDIPFPPDSGDETGDAWLGVFKSTDSGQTWRSTLLPGYPQDQSAAGLASPLKAFAVATDPTVRAGTHGMFYYSGLTFNRGNNAPSAVFVARFQDQNNKGNGDPFTYLSAALVDNGNTGQFLDKPWLAADAPRPGTAVGAATCTVDGRTFTSGNVYLVYSVFLGNQPQNNPHSQINFVKSADCGATWTKAVKLSESYTLNQGTVAAVDPATGALWVAWRQIGTVNQPDAILYVVSSDGGNTFSKGAVAFTFPAGSAFDQPSSAGAFRTVALPSLAVDNSSRVYLAWSQRGKGPFASARIMISTLARGSGSWTTPYVADPTATGPGHQFLPAFTSGWGKLMLIFYDLRDDNTAGRLQCPAGTACRSIQDFAETRIPLGDLAAGNPSAVYTPVVSDAGLKIRHTLDVRGALVDPSQFNAAATTPLAFPSFRISQYKYGSRPGSNIIEQLQFNPPNFPLFVKGTRPFLGDYIEVSALTFVVDASGNWTFNTQPSNAAVFHATWTDNRDVRPPPPTCSNGICSQDWTSYTPVGSTGGASLYDPTQTKPVCMPGQAGMRNQNIYSSRITQGLYVGLRENSKQLVNASGAPLERAFSVFAQNNLDTTAFYRLMIGTPPAGTTASFSDTSALVSLDVSIPRRSSIARSVFVISASAHATVTVSVEQITAVGGAVASGGLKSSVAINPDITNPDIVNPDIINPDITNPDITNPDITNPDITSAEVYNPTVTNPDITNPDIINPDITSFSITNPDITNPDIINPDITSIVAVNPDIINPSVTNPDITNPDITNPDITNPDIVSLPAGTGVTDYTWKLTNRGNTTASYNAKLFLKQSQCCPAGCSPGALNCPAACFQCQLVIRRTYPTPTASACTLAVETQNVPISSIPGPSFAGSSNAGTPDASPDPTNATVSLGPGEGGRVTLRVFGLSTTSTTPPVKPVGVSSGANTGQTQPSASLTLTTLELPVAVVGNPYRAALQSVGGVGAARKWSFLTGVLPAGLTLDPSTGQITGVTMASAGAYNLTAQVQDSPPSPTEPHADQQAMTLGVNQLSITTVTAANSTTGTSWLKGSQSATVTVVVSNQGPASATTVTPSLTVNGSGVNLTCGPAAPQSADIAGGGTQTFTYTCGPPDNTSNGSVTFSVQAAGTYVNSAGSSPAATVVVVSNPIVVDNTPPAMTATATAGGNSYSANTWTNQNVVVTFACTDSLSGVAFGNPTGNTTVILETTSTGVSVSGGCADNAGNLATLTFGPILIDKTPPMLSFGAASPGANPAGWNNTNVAVPFTASDALSGLRSTIPAASPLVVATEGSLVAGSVTATDRAGNSATFASPAFKIDKTPPTVSVTSPANGATYLLNATISAAYNCADGLSGLATCVASQANGAAFKASAVGLNTFVVSATDIATNVTTVTNTYSVAYTFLGFFTPLQAAGTPSAPTVSGSFNLGKVLPLKWELDDASRTPVVDLSSLSLLQAVRNPACAGPPPSGAATVVLYSPTSGAAGNSTFRVSSSGTQYIFNWDTTSVSAGCYNLVAQMKDTRSYATVVQLK